MEMEFHPRVGPNVELSDGNMFARRRDSDRKYDQAIVFSNQPLKDDRLFEVRIEEKADRWNDKCGLMIGVTSHRPNFVSCSSLLRALDVLPHSWIIVGGEVVWDEAASDKSFPVGELRNLNVGDHVGVLRKHTGALHLYVNGEDKGEAYWSVPSGCYAALEIYGNCAAVSIGNHTADTTGMISIDISSWKIVGLKDRLPIAADLLNVSSSDGRQNKKLKTSFSDGDCCIIPSQRYSHKMLPGFEWFLKIYPKGYANEANGFVAVELCVEKSGKKSSATAPSALFSASLTSAKDSTRPVFSKLTIFGSNAACVIEEVATRERAEALCADDGSLSLSGKIFLASPISQQTEYLRQSYESGAFSDFHIAVESELVQFAVHKHVIAAASPFFERMFSAEYDEAKEGKLTIRESNLDAVKAMLQFIYGDPLCFDGLQDLSIDALKLADFYDLSGLKEMCEQSLARLIAKSDVLLFAQIADCCNSEYLKKAAFQFIYDNKEIMDSVEWANFQKEKCILVNEVLRYIIAKQFDALSKK